MEKPNQRGATLFSRLGIGLAAIFLVGFGIVFWARGGYNFSPGPVTAATKPGVTLEGFASHAAFEKQLLTDILKPTNKKQRILSTGVVVPERSRCVQCGICSYNCPIGIDVRQHAMHGASIVDSRCLTCGECVLRCPRSVLHFEYKGPAEVLPTGAK